MELTESQRDAITELVNIGYGRAAAALSELTGHRIQLEVPQISLRPIEEIVPLLDELVQGEVASVNQVFTGPISGNAFLLMDEASAMILSRLLRDDDSLPGSFDANGQEIITEVGNILLNACLGVFGNLLQVPMAFAVPRLQMAGIGRVLKTFTRESGEWQYGLMFHTHFSLQGSNVTGYLIIVLGISSLDRLLQEVDNWEVRQSP